MVQGMSCSNDALRVDLIRMISLSKQSKQMQSLPQVSQDNVQDRRSLSLDQKEPRPF